MNALYNAEAEEAVLGALLIEPDRLTQVAFFLRPKDFYIQRNAWVYEAILELHEDGVAVDVVTLADYLERKEKLEGLGGAARLTELLGAVPSALHCVDYARSVAQRAIDRRLKGAAEKIAGFAHQDLPAEEKLVKAQDALADIEVIYARPEAMNAEQAARALGDLMEEYAADPLAEDEVRGYSYGIVDLDKMLRGLKPGVVLVGGVTHVGKSAFVVQIAVNVAQAGGRVLLIETEDTAEQMWARVYALLCGLDIDDLERGLDDRQRYEYKEAMREAQGWDMEIIAKSITVQQVALEVRSRRLDLVVVDNLETPSLAYDGDQEWQRFRRAAYGLLSVAQENKVPVLTTMQVSKHKLERRKNKVPQMEDLYGADGPAQAASVVLTLHREDVWNIGRSYKHTGELLVSCFKDKLSHKGAGRSVTLQFGDEGQVRALAPEDVYLDEPVPEQEPIPF